jgi:hypothetical protein
MSTDDRSTDQRHEREHAVNSPRDTKPRPGPIALVGCSVLSALCLTLNLGCGGDPTLPATGQQTPSVLLIVLDTLRADHLSVSGYDRDTSPTIDGLAEGGVRFTDALAPSNWTVPSTASLVTSLYPAEHGAGLTGAVRHLARLR